MTLRKMRSLLVAATVVSLAVVLVATSWGNVTGGSHKHRGKPRCSLRGSFTRYQDTVLRVFTKDWGPDAPYDTYTCSFSTNKRRRIARVVDRFGGSEVDLLRVRHPFIAYSLVGGDGHGGTNGSVCVLHLNTMAVRCEPTDDYAADGLGLTRAGSLAWMDYHFVRPGYARSVHKLDAGTTGPVLLDSGANIDPGSFAVGGHFIYWTKAGQPQSATMP